MSGNVSSYDAKDDKLMEEVLAKLEKEEKVEKEQEKKEAEKDSSRELMRLVENAARSDAVELRKKENTEKAEELAKMLRDEKDHIAARIQTIEYRKRLADREEKDKKEEKSSVVVLMESMRPAYQEQNNQLDQPMQSLPERNRVHLKKCCFCTTEVHDHSDVARGDAIVLPSSLSGYGFSDKAKETARKLVAEGCETNGKRYYKVLSPNERWFVGCQDANGETSPFSGYMVDTDSVNVMDEICPGRLFVYEEDQIPTFLRHDDVYSVNYIAVVEIPNEAEVVKGFRKINTNMVKVMNIFPLADYWKWDDESFCYDMVRRFPGFFRHVRNQNYDICALAVQSSPNNMIYVKNKLKGLYWDMVRANPLELKRVPKEMIDSYIAYDVVERNNMALEFVPDELKTRDLCEMAVTTMAEDENECCHDKDSECFCGKWRFRRPVDIKGYALKFVPYEFHDVAMYRKAKVLCNMMKKELIDYDMCVDAVKLNGLELKFVPEGLLSDELVSMAVDQNTSALEFVPAKMQTKELCWNALKRNVNALKFIKKQTQKQIMYAMSKNPDAYELVDE